MDGIMKTLTFINASIAQATPQERSRMTNKLHDSIYCAKYERGEQISNSADSSVFVVRQRNVSTRSCRPCAAKYLKSNSSASIREADILRRLKDGPNLLQLVEVFHCEFHVILVTEYLAGGDLFERVSSCEYQLTEGKCQIFMRQILRGLQHLHSLNIVHMDIKPFNILFKSKTDDYGLKISDFSKAQVLEEEKELKFSRIKGTVEFIAPELINCETVNTYTDMWSAGVVAYMLVSGGVSPFYSGSRCRTIARTLSCEYDLNVPEMTHTSPQAKSLISQLLLNDPGSRLTAEGALEHPWLDSDRVYVEVLFELETTWMRKCLARRRWYRALNALRAMHTMRKHSIPDSVSEDDPESTPECPVASASRIAVVEEKLEEPRPYEEYKLKYERICLIGSGTFGSVHYIKDKETGEVAAAKYLRQEKSQVRQEAAILRKLIQSAMIVQLIGLYESTLNSVLVTEFLSGGDLVTRTASDDFTLTERKCQIFIRQVVRGVQFIHSKRIVHLDLKPFNIIFANPNDDYNLRIIDFGLAEQLPPCDHTLKIKMCGTLEYMSPEVMDCKFASLACDMWGVGVISYLLVSGGLSPFWAGNRYRTMAKVLSCDYSFDAQNFAHVSQDAQDFISSLLVRNPDERMTATDCLSHPWLTDNRVYVEVLHTLETAWMKGLLARRRWHRWYHAIIAMNRMRKLSADTR